MLCNIIILSEYIITKYTMDQISSALLL